MRTERRPRREVPPARYGPKRLQLRHRHGRLQKLIKIRCSDNHMVPPVRRYESRRFNSAAGTESILWITLANTSISLCSLSALSFSMHPFAGPASR